MKMTWKKKSSNKRLAVVSHLVNNNLPFENQLDHTNFSNSPKSETLNHDDDDPSSTLFDSFLQQGNKFAEDGKYREALGKWEAAITLMPEKAVLHEQKAQVLLEIGDAWGALKAVTRATELDPSWAEAWTTLGRAQLNFGEPDSAIESFDKALALKPDLAEAQDDKRTALRLLKKRNQLHASGISIDRSRYVVSDGAKTDH